MRRIPGLVLVAAALAGCGGGDEPKQATKGLFAYDASAPLGYKDAGPVNPDYPIAVHDVSYANPKGGRVTAFLVVPPTEGRHPGIVYVHGAGGDRQQLVVQATWMAARGAVALVLDMPAEQAETEADGWLEALAQQRALTARSIVALRRGVDVLHSLPSVDPERIAFVGWSSGARFGAILSGVERRIGAYSLLAGGAVPPARYAAQAPEAMKAEVIRGLGTIDPLRHVKRAAPARLLLQNGRRDEVVPQDALEGLARAASQPKDVRWYEEMGHEPSAVAYREQLEWLSGELGLGPVLVEGVLAGPE